MAMLAKVVTRNGKRPGSFARTDEYIERFEAAMEVRHSKNLRADLSIPVQMQRTAAQGTGRVRNPVYHYVLSWDTDAISSERIWHAVEKSLVALGCDEHEWVAARHIDTKHAHVHIMVNRIHPRTFRAWRPQHDYLKLRRLCQQLEPKAQEQEREQPPISSRAADHEIWSGQMSMQTWGREQVWPGLQSVFEMKRPSWKRFHAILADRFGATYEVVEGEGYIVDRSGGRHLAVRATGISPRLQLQRLEAAMGEFTPTPYAIVPVKEHGYGYRRARWDLATAPMRDPLIAPLYRRFINEQIRWQTSGRLIAKRERMAIMQAYRGAKDEAARDAEDAMRLLRPIEGMRGTTARSMLGLLMADDRRRLKEDMRRQMQTVAKMRPNELFRQWLKDLSNDGDVSAGVAIVRLRKKPVDSDAILSLLETVTSPTLGETMQTDPTAIHSAVQQFIEEARKAHSAGFDFVGATTSEQQEAFQRIMGNIADYPFANEYAAALSEAREGFSSQEQQVLAPALLAIVGVEDLAPADIRVMYGPCDTIQGYASLGNAFAGALGEKATEAASEHSGTVEANVGKVETTAQESPAADPGLPADDLDEERPEDLEVDVEGSISSAPIDRTMAYNDHFASVEDQIKANAQFMQQYEAYLEQVGGGIYKDQAKVYDERKRLLGENFNAQRDELKASGLKDEELRAARSVLIARGMKAQATLERSYRQEEEILIDIMGLAPPKTYREFLEGLNNADAKALADVLTIAEQPSPLHRPKEFKEAHELAADMTWTELGDGKVQYKYKGKDAFIDMGGKISVPSCKNREGARLALLMAIRKYDALNGGIVLNGSNAYKTQMLKLAVEMGLGDKIKNEELQEQRKALEAEQQKKLAAERAKIDKELSEAVSKEKPRRTEIEAIINDASLSAEERDERIESIVSEQVVKHMRAEMSGSDVHFCEGDEQIEGALKDVLVFNQRAYVVLENHEGGYVARVPKDEAKRLCTQMNEDLRIERAAIGQYYDVMLTERERVSGGRARG